mmetsp:Transcript_69913/g.186236  ORF Transcript_69913/g.186236 Transcript_69913/m.186236 type:complete len:675 (+) Transcript_69913:138-2162(+)
MSGQVALEVTHPLPKFVLPQEALSYVPRDKDIKQHFKGGDWERKIYCNLQLDPFEEEKIHEFVQQNTDLPLTRTMRARIMRYISHSRNDLAKARQCLEETQKWRNEFFQTPVSDRDEKLLEALRLGFASYIARDDGLRPVLLIRVKVATQNPNVFGPETCLKLIAFCMEFMARFMVVPGKVEQQIVIIDLADVSLTGIPVSALKSVVNTLSKHYVGRVYQMHVLNAPYLISGLYSVVKPLLTDRQQQKIKFASNPKDLFSEIMALHHIPKCYGGSRPDIQCYYPFDLLPGPFTAGYAGGPSKNATPNCHRAVGRLSSIGVLWEGGISGTARELAWTSEAAAIFEHLGLPQPKNTGAGCPFEIGEAEVVSVAGEDPPMPGQDRRTIDNFQGPGRERQVWDKPDKIGVESKPNGDRVNQLASTAPPSSADSQKYEGMSLAELQKTIERSAAECTLGYEWGVANVGTNSFNKSHTRVQSNVEAVVISEYDNFCADLAGDVAPEDELGQRQILLALRNGKHLRDGMHDQIDLDLSQVEDGIGRISNFSLWTRKDGNKIHVVYSARNMLFLNPADSFTTRGWDVPRLYSFLRHKDLQKLALELNSFSNIVSPASERAAAIAATGTAQETPAPKMDGGDVDDNRNLVGDQDLEIFDAPPAPQPGFFDCWSTSGRPCGMCT